MFRWGVFRKSMPTVFSVEPRYIKWIFMNFSIFWHHRQLTHHPWINLKQPSQIWTTNMLSKAPCHDEVSNHLHFCKQVHQKQTPLGKCRCHYIQHNHNLKSHSCLGICRNMVWGRRHSVDSESSLKNRLQQRTGSKTCLSTVGSCPPWLHKQSIWKLKAPLLGLIGNTLLLKLKPAGNMVK